jgi:LPS-assembly protein
VRNHWFILGSFFVLIIVAFSSRAHAQVGETGVRGVSVPEGMKAEGPVNIEAEKLTYDKETQTYEAHGQAEVSQGDLFLKADHARLNMATNELAAWGNVLLREGEDVVECERLEVNIETRLGRIYKARLYLKDQNFHVTGREAEKLGENHYRIFDGSLTTCDAKRPPWKFTAKEIEVKEMALGGTGTAKGPIFYFEDIPVLYFPWGVFPVLQERQSGFLIPQGGYSSTYGVKFENAFYWAFAKNMDATLYLDYLGDRGFKEALQYNYAFTQETKGQANFYFIDDQMVHKDRYAFFIQHEEKLPDDFYLKADINRVSDHQYFQDFRSESLPETAQLAEIDAVTLSLLRSTVFAGKNWDQFSFLVNNEVFDDFTQTDNQKTIQMLPQASFYAHPQSLFNTPFFYSITSSYTDFWRERGIESNRGDLFPTISYPVRLLDVLKFESDVGLRETFYRNYNDHTGTFEGWESRETLQANAQMSAEFYRVYDAETFSMISDFLKVSKWMHSIEPTVSYQYSPPVNQSGLPIYDAVDRIPYTNQVTYGFTQVLLGKPEQPGGGVSSGAFEYAKLKISQSYSLGDPSWYNPLYIDTDGKKRSFSDIEGQLWLNFNPYLSTYADTEFNPYRASFDAFNFTMVAKDQRNDAVAVGYANTRSTLGTSKEINLDARVKTIPPLYLFGSYYYNLLTGTWVQWIIGAEYQTQCWSAGFIVQDINRNVSIKKELQFNFYFNLLNIGSLGRRPYHMKL